MKKTNPLVSIIIPMYAVEVYLEECIDSVLAQTYKNLEIILVDDGSPDRCGEIADAYAQKDKRIKVIHKENGGLSDARNVGILSSAGQYLFFLDSDDYITDNTIESLLTLCLEKKAEIAVSGLARFDNATTKREKKYKNCKKEAKNSTRVYNKVEGLRAMLLHDGFGYEAPGKLYLTTLWNNIKFPVGKLYEDYATTYKLLFKANKIVVQSESTYFYRNRPDSIMTSQIKERNLILLDISNNVTEEICRVIPGLESEAKYLQIRTNMKMLENILNTGRNSFPDAQERIINLVKKEGKILLKASYVRKIDKIKLGSLMISKRLFMVAYWFGEKANMAKIKKGRR